MASSSRTSSERSRTYLWVSRPLIHANEWRDMRVKSPAEPPAHSRAISRLGHIGRLLDGRGRAWSAVVGVLTSSRVRCPGEVAGTVFVGRHGERERLAGVLRGDPGSAGAALVTGDAGIGKSRLLAEVAAAVPDVAVLVGSCLPMSESLPYGAITDAFDQLTGPAGRPVLDKALSRCAPFVAPQIAALIPALSAEAHPAANVTADRTRLFTAVRDVLAALGAARRTALVVEDLHWADAGTLDLLTFLVRSPPPGTALLATSRRDELRRTTLRWTGSPPPRASRRRGGDPRAAAARRRRRPGCVPRRRGADRRVRRRRGPPR